MKVAFLFPGQGAQKVGMGWEFYENFPQGRAVFARANELLGFDLATLCFAGPEEILRETDNAQVALFVTSIAALRCLESICARRPDAVAGHSVGEYAALVAAGTLNFDDGLNLVRRRGELMRDAARSAPGAMAAVLGLDAETARQVCEEARAAGAGLVVVANYNGAGQTVISGSPEAVEKAGAIAREKGARRVIPLAVSGAFHSPLMVAAGDALFAYLSQTAFRKPEAPVVSNVTARYVEMPDDLTGGLTRQVSGCVRWEESMQMLLQEGVDTFIELGSGDVLTGLMRRMEKSVQALSVQDADSLQAACRLLSSETG
ncbi:MAG TPA: ACP S-malonyltransferase [Chthonomonadaceae bacterium]|nr:ACP S-malonyltransferase [Chthonomonadaceae bacterium]